MVAIVIAVSQGKGGAAKTTTSVNLAGALNEIGYSTFLFDWDIGKPDAVKWKGDGQYINWIKPINKENPVKDIEEAKLNYEFLIFDTPPNYEQNAFKAIMASDFVIIPTSINYLDQENAKDAISVPMLAKKPFKILMSKVKRGTKEGKEIEENIYKQDISFKVIVTDRNVIAQCPRSSQWIGQFAKGSDSHEQFLALAREVISWTGIKEISKLYEVAE
ncbi:flagellar biosynthesis MinD [Legionella busanensis]|uniref:Flagellar biosynthesis MinD n=1 Tax=Legionella busanensis TaxID=190655 RepID=A0A378K9P9_9GAMM|nr:ParA family protein [Legionella busanensis]STX81239.1 flagellar biosynthesis MinD [Legionella busanensis]